MSLENKSYRLKRYYKMGVEDNGNYIVSLRGTKCVFLNPLAAFVLNILIKSNTIEAKNQLMDIFNLDEPTSIKHVQRIVSRIFDYIEETEHRDVVLTHNEAMQLTSKEILRREKNYVCPITKSPVPRKIKFYLTDYCPRYCVYCFAGAKHKKGKIKNSDFLSVDRFKEIIKEAVDIGVQNIEIGGGDPFILENIDEYLQVMIENFNGEWGTSTKAFLSKEDVAKLSAINLKEIQVSIDSDDPTIADKMMGVKDSHSEILQTIRNLMDAGILVSTKTTITSINIHTIPELFNKLVSLGVHNIRFAYYYFSANRHNDYLYPTNEQFAWLNKQMEQPVREAIANGVQTDFTPHGPHNVSNNEAKRVFCGGFTENMGVRYDGGILFCDSLNHCDDFIAGNLKEMGIMEAWNSQGVKDMNNPYYFYEKYKGKKCYTCHMYKNCFYKRCYVRSFIEYGDFFDVDPACPFGIEGYIIK